MTTAIPPGARSTSKRSTRASASVLRFEGVTRPWRSSMQSAQHPSTSFFSNGAMPEPSPCRPERTRMPTSSLAPYECGSIRARAWLATSALIRPIAAVATKVTSSQVSTRQQARAVATCRRRYQNGGAVATIDPFDELPIASNLLGTQQSQGHGNTCEVEIGRIERASALHCSLDSPARFGRNDCDRP